MLIWDDIRHQQGYNDWGFLETPNETPSEIHAWHLDDHPTRGRVFNLAAPYVKLSMGMSENGVYPQWNSHLVGIIDHENHWV